jgi:beta-phosphoglucomutase-like phosphatase (HAD superfamily)
MVFGCIFDWDGVISDSSAHHIEAWKMLAREENLEFPEHLFKQSFGMKNEQIIPQLFKWTTDMAEIQRLDRRKELLYRSRSRALGLFCPCFRSSTFPASSAPQPRARI